MTERLNQSSVPVGVLVTIVQLVLIVGNFLAGERPNKCSVIYIYIYNIYIASTVVVLLLRASG